MAPLPHTRWRRLLAALLAAGFFALLLVYVGRHIDPRLAYHRQGPIFFRGEEFVEEFQGRPGGPAEYAAAFLAQIFYYRWPGALVLAVMAATVCLATWLVLARVRGRLPVAIPLVPALLLLIPWHDYNYPLGPTVALAAVLAALAGYAWLPLRAAWLRAVVFAALAAVLYYAAAGAMLVFAAMAGLLELLAPPGEKGSDPFNLRRAMLLLVYLAVGAAIPLAAAAASHASLADSYTRLLAIPVAADHTALVSVIALYVYLPLAAIVAACCGGGPCSASGEGRRGSAPAPHAHATGGAGMPPADNTAGQVAESTGRPGRGTPARRRLLGRLAGHGWLWSAAAVAVMAAALVRPPLSNPHRPLLEIDFYSEERMWPEVLEAAWRLGPANAYVQHDIAKALYHTGRLPEDLFAYPMSRVYQPVPPSLSDFYIPMNNLKMSDVLLDLGRVNESEHMAYEALETLGPRPAVLRRLAVLNVIKGQHEAARVFLARLALAPWHGEWADRVRLALDADPRLASDGDVERIRGLMLRTDSTEPQETEPSLVYLLMANPRNRMALEFLMTHYLLTGQAGKVGENVARLGAAGYADIPRHWEEAILLAQDLSGRPQPDLFGRRIRPETAARFRGFMQRLRPNLRDQRAAWDALHAEYGDTYWFFYVFGCSSCGRQGPPAPSPPAKEAGP